MRDAADPRTSVKLPDRVSMPRCSRTALHTRDEKISSVQGRKLKYILQKYGKEPRILLSGMDPMALI